jgi:hypothetical protein
MRIAIPLLLLLALIPLAEARPLPDPGQGDHTVGPCRVQWTFGLDADARTVACVVAGEEVLYYSEGTSMLGHWCVLRVAGQTLQQCSDGA